MSSPKKRMVPDDGGKSPVTQLNSVVLPAPLEPSTARRSPGRTVIVTSVNAASAPNSRVTPRSSSAAAPSLPESDHAIRRPEHDGEEAEADQQPEAVTVEPELDQEIKRKGAQDDEDEGADEGANGTGDAADHRDNQDID